MTNEEIEKLAELISKKLIAYEEIAREEYLNHIKGSLEGNIQIVDGIDYEHRSHKQLLKERLEELKKSKNGAIREERFEDVIEISKLINKIEKQIENLS